MEDWSLTSTFPLVSGSLKYVVPLMVSFSQM